MFQYKRLVLVYNKSVYDYDKDKYVYLRIVNNEKKYTKLVYQNDVWTKE